MGDPEDGRRGARDDSLVLSAVSVYLKARLRKIEELETETKKEREKRLEKKRDWNRRNRANGKLRDVGDEVFGFPEVEVDVPMPPVAPPRNQWRELDERRDLIEKIADRRRKD